MSRYWLIVPLALAVTGLALGCGSTDKAEETTQKAEAVKTPASQELAQATVLEGKLGCGHCSFRVKNECSLAMETEDGDVFLIDAGERQEDLMAQRYDQPAVKIEGRVAEVDGIKVIYTDSVLLQ